MMESKCSDAVMVSAVDEAECSETTVQIKIKTLDSQTYTLQVNKRVPVPELKEQIETVSGVVSNQQRLICRGQFLKDDQLLSAYHVEDGHTLHLVVSQPLPPSSEPTNSSTGSESFADPATDPALNAGQSRVALAHSILLGSFNVADQGDAGIPDLGRIVSAVLGSIGMNNLASSTNIVENRGLSTESGAETLEIPARATGVSSTQTDPQRDSSHGAFYHPSTAPLGSLQLPVIPDSLTTLYLCHLRHEFISIGGHSSNLVDAATCLNEEHEQNSTSSATQVGLPTAASLADVMASTRKLLFEQVGQSLAQLARQLVDQASLTNQSSRAGIQSSAMGTGVSLQNLGALLLELGRTTMTLRIGQTPPDAVVNAGPAVFISPSGPNPIMVQPLPFQPGSGFRATSTRRLSAGSALSGFFPRNIDIRIRTVGSSLNTSNVNQGEQVGTQQTPGQTGPAKDPGSGIAHQEEVRVSGVPSLNGESGFRVVPVRTMVAAVPAGATRTTSGSPGSSAGLLFPIIARVQHLAPVQANSVRGSQPSSEHHPSNPEADRQQNPNAPVQPQNVRVTIGATRRDGFAGIGDPFFSPFSSGMMQMQMPSLRMQDPLGSLGSRSNTGSGSRPPNGEETASQIPRSHQVHTANFGSQAEATDSTNSQGANRNDATPRLGIDDGIFLSRLIREVLPYISQNSTSEPTSISPEGVDGSNSRNSQTPLTQSADRQTDAGTSRRRNDPPPTSPNGKRQKRE